MQGIFVGTFLIGLREGLEAALIVGIVAAFLKRNGRSVRPMLGGVGVAVAISIAGGVALNLLSETLPQRQQEMLETVIGAIAVVFVTTMIIWMNRNASALKGELEREAQQAITTGARWPWPPWRFSPCSRRASKPRCSFLPPPKRLAAAVGGRCLAARSASRWRSSSALASTTAHSSCTLAGFSGSPACSWY